MASLPESGGSLVSRAMEAVKLHIRESGMRVGDTLPGEAYFAEKFGVSRAVMREAFGGLAALRLIDVANGRRAKVGALDGSVMAASLDHALSTSQIKVADVWDVRRTIEMRTAALAARNATPVQAARIVALAEAMGKDDQPHNETTEDDIEFHLAIAEASGNALFNQIVVSFVPLMRIAVPRAWRTRQTEDEKRDILGRHKRLAWAIANGDSAQAESCMAEHFDEAIGALLR